MKRLLHQVVVICLVLFTFLLLSHTSTKAYYYEFDGSYIPSNDQTQTFTSIRDWNNNNDGTVSPVGADTYIYPSAWQVNAANDGPDQTSDISIEFRWKDSSNAVNYPVIIKAQQIGPNNLLDNYKFHFVTDSNGLTVFICDGDCNKTIAVSPLDVTEWHTYKLVKTGTQIELFVDDISQGTQVHNPPKGLKFQLAGFGNLVPPGNWRYSHLDYFKISGPDIAVPNAYSRFFDGTSAPIGSEVSISNYGNNNWHYDNFQGIASFNSTDLDSYHSFNLTQYNIPYIADWRFTMKFKCVISPGDNFFVLKWGNGYMADFLWWKNNTLQLFSNNNYIDSGIACDNNFHNYEIRRHADLYKLIVDDVSKGTIPAPSLPSSPAAGYNFQFFNVGAMNQDIRYLTTHYELDDYMIDIPYSYPPDNLLPQACIDGPMMADEGQLFSLDASCSTDPDNNIVSYEWDTDNDGVFDDASGAVAQISYPDNGSFPISLKVTDAYGLSNTSSTTATINNVAPIADSLSVSSNLVPIGTSISSQTTFTDPGADTWIAAWVWGDSNTDSEAVSDFSLTKSHTYTTPGVYTPALTITDDDGGTSITTYQYLVVYDSTSSSSFITGSGSIQSPAGAYLADPSVAGTAQFGFVSKYQNGASAPEGNTKFKFKTANFTFDSVSYDWLVVSGKKATFKGIGNVNGSDNYHFLLSAIDGDLLGGDGMDKFRLKIWQLDSEGNEITIYDNQINNPLDADPSTIITAGSIVIHKN